MNSSKPLASAILAFLVATPGPALGGRIPAEYPVYASENCIEGYVRVSYMHSEEGQPLNIKILEASPEGIFEESTLRNLSYWRNPDQAGKTKEMTLEYTLDDHGPCNS